MHTNDHFLLPRCAGMNCGATDANHSPECRAEHAAAVAGGRFVKDAALSARADGGKESSDAARWRCAIEQDWLTSAEVKAIDAAIAGDKR